MDGFYELLCRVTGEQHVSAHPEELFIYSRDQGTMEPHWPDYVVMPRTVEEVQRIVYLANEYKVPIVPMGGGLVLSGLTIPLKGGIVLDMKRMDSIIEINRESRYAVVEAGVSQGQLQSYLAYNYPDLKHSVPDAPPIATIAGNVAIHGSGHLSQPYGFHSDMVNGLEVVLPTGEICNTGSSSASYHWFSRSPLPDLSGLFLGWLGTTGIITKIGLKLYPAKKIKDVMMFVTEEPGYIPDVIYRVTDTETAEDVVIMAAPKPDWMNGFQLTKIAVTANTQEELSFKKKLIRYSLMDYITSKEGGFMFLTPEIKEPFLDAPQRSVARSADIKKGGGFEYVGAILPVEKFPQAYHKGLEIVKKYEIPYSFMIRVIGRAHSMMFAFAYPFNRADSNDMQGARNALHETNKATLELGGIPWKPEVPAQELIMENMNSNTKKMFNQLKKLLDPNGIMNPGNWEVQ